ncbi:MAG: hypothetical protein OEV28_08520 [Nitrospirota bacterium]|nr:hypothetical protein [Nitrospirota bacterium]
MSGPKEFSYKIGNKKYVQKALVLGQIRQLTGLLDGVVLPSDTSDIVAWVRVLGNKLPGAIAVVLVEEGAHLKDKDLELFTRDIEFEISPEQTMQVVQDFFVCNPIASLLENLSGAITKITESQGPAKTGSNALSSISAPETSLKETASSGDTP